MARKAKEQPKAAAGPAIETCQPQNFTPFEVPTEIGPFGCVIIGHGWENADQLLAHPSNPRIHPKAQQDALKGSLDTLGWYGRGDS